MVLEFIGVVKHSLYHYPIVRIQSKEFIRRGYSYGLVSVYEGVPEMMSFAWVDQYIRYSIDRRV